MNVFNKFFLVGFVLFSSCNLVARLSDEQILLMAGAGYTAADYEAETAGMTDCETLQYYLNNMMGVTSALTRTIIKGYLMYRNYANKGGDFTACDLGFVTGETATVLAAPADLTGADFTGATMDSIKLNEALLNGVNMQSCSLTSATFDSSSAAAQTVIFTGANLTGSTFSNVFMVEPYFDSSTLTNVKFSNAKLPQANFKSATLINTEFFLCDLQDADFTGANCTGAKFYSTRGTVWFSGTNLKDADFAQTTLFYFYYDASNPPIFNNTTMPDGNKCTGADCIKHFVDITA